MYLSEHRGGRGHEGGLLQRLPDGRGIQHRDGEAGDDDGEEGQHHGGRRREIVRDSLTSWLEEDGYHRGGRGERQEGAGAPPERAWT